MGRGGRTNVAQRMTPRPPQHPELAEIANGVRHEVEEVDVLVATVRWILDDDRCHPRRQRPHHRSKEDIRPVETWQKHERDWMLHLFCIVVRLCDRRMTCKIFGYLERADQVAPWTQ